MDMSNYRARIAALLPQGLIAADDIVAVTDSTKGDYCLPCFRLAKTMRKSPQAIASELGSGIQKPDWIEKIEAIAGYLNFTLARVPFIAETVRTFYDGVVLPKEGCGRTVCIDYSSVNIAKPFHMGHLPSTAIGGSLARIFTALGYRVVSINHLGDYGTQFGKLIAAFRRTGTVESVSAGGVKELQRIYVGYAELEKSDPAIKEEARGWSLKIEQGDPTATQLFEMFKAITMDEVRRIYDLLGIRFDSYRGESYYAGKVPEVVAELERGGLLSESEGAKVVNLGEDMPPCLILRGDGASLYASRDLATALARKKEYDFDKCLYVVAYQQNLHFKQFFRVLELMGKPWAKDLEHIAFGMVSIEGASLSSRKGNVVYLADVLDAAVEETGRIMREKNAHVGDALEEAARSVGVGAVIFSALSSAKIKDVSFSLEKVLSFEGETGPYLQYTHARCCSVLAKADISGLPADFDGTDNEEAKKLCAELAGFCDVVVDAAEKREPCLISKQLLSIAAAFNKFYFEHKIIADDQKIMQARLALVQATKNVLAFGLNLILMDAVKAM